MEIERLAIKIARVDSSSCFLFLTCFIRGRAGPLLLHQAFSGCGERASPAEPGLSSGGGGAQP